MVVGFISGAETVPHLRGVHDAINMGRLLNLTLEQVPTYYIIIRTCS